MKQTCIHGSQIMTRRVFRATLIACVALLWLSPSAPAAEKKLKVAFALLWTIDDQGWTTCHYRGILHLQQALGHQVQLAYTEKVMAPNAERVFRYYASQGYDIIFGTTFEHMDALVRVARDYPDIRFEHCAGYKSSSNMGNYFVRIYQAEFLSGYMAGLMGFKNVGTVATQPIPEPIRGINAFTLGLLKGLNEADVEHDPDKVNTVVWLMSWRDPINEIALAETLVVRGHDLVRQMADTPDSSLAACAQGVPAIGYGTDAAEYGAKCALVSSLFNWGPYYLETVQQVMDGSWTNREYWKGFEADGVELSAFNNVVPQDVRDKVLAEMDKLKAGDDTIFVGPIHAQDGTLLYKEGEKASDADLLSMRVFVNGVSGGIPE
jgi:basic membrane protein A and related proteins